MGTHILLSRGELHGGKPTPISMICKEKQRMVKEREVHTASSAAFIANALGIIQADQRERPLRYLAQCHEFKMR
jgi:hypothetical protein